MSSPAISRPRALLALCAALALLALASCGSSRAGTSAGTTSGTGGGTGAASTASTGTGGGAASSSSASGGGGAGTTTGGTGGAGGAPPLPCDPRFSFSPGPIVGGTPFQATFTDTPGYVYIGLDLSGPGMPAASNLVISGNGPYSWTWTVSGQAAGTLTLTFVKDANGSPGTPVASCQVAVGPGGPPPDAGPAGCTPGDVACSKIGAQVLGSTPAFTSFLSACPRIAKWVGTAGSQPPWDEIAAYKCACKGTTVLRMYGPPGNYATGQALWDARYQVLEGATPAQKASLDYLESDNECDAGHCYDSGGAADYATFLSQWIDVAVSHGYKPLVLNMAVGNPPGDVSSCSSAGTQTFGQLVPAIVKAGQAGGGWAYHAYTPQWSQDASGYESYYALRYRRFTGCFPITSVPLVLSEGGFDAGGNPDSDGYLANGGAAQLFPWLSWLSGELANDAYVKGITLFAFAPPGQWSSFRLDDNVASLEQTIGPATCSP
jgi:hypothetical protein